MWIETSTPIINAVLPIVTPLAGVWIETCAICCDMAVPTTSLPLRECGLKRCLLRHHHLHTPSLPLRECGLKPTTPLTAPVAALVTPLAGVWIETP